MSNLDKKTLLNVPNLVTYGRIILIPVIAALMMIQGPQYSFETNRLLSLIAASIFILTGISDLLDGYYARKYQMTSLMGKFFDPMADKLVHMTVLILLIPMGRMPAIIPVILLFREIYIMGLRAIAAGEGMIIQAGKSGKRKTAWLNVSLAALIIHYPLGPASSFTVGWVAMVFAMYYSLYSALEYSILFFKSMSQKEKL